MKQQNITQADKYLTQFISSLCVKLLRPWIITLQLHNYTCSRKTTYFIHLLLSQHSNNSKKLTWIEDLQLLENCIADTCLDVQYSVYFPSPRGEFLLRLHVHLSPLAMGIYLSCIFLFFFVTAFSCPYVILIYAVF